MTFIKDLAEHFDAGDRGALSVANTNNFDLFAGVTDTGLDLAGNHCASTRNRENVLNWHQEGLVIVAIRFRNSLINSCHEFQNLVSGSIGTF